MEPSYTLTVAIHARLVASSAVTSLVPATSIGDHNGLPTTFPCVIIGEGQTLPDDGISRNRHEVFADLHIWQTELGLTGAKNIAGAIRAALSDGPLTATGLHVVGLQIASTRFLRDPDGKHSHGVMSIRARVMEVA
ncbi:MULTISPECIES: DUF3168 domain-containing protein [Chelativorans]|jgi:hypothetical protein|nr:MULTISPECIES: DUF3168 domain-containing protein [Chelativorans]